MVTNRGDAAAFDAALPWRRVAAPPRLLTWLFRGDESRGDAAAATRLYQRRRASRRRYAAPPGHRPACLEDPVVGAVAVGALPPTFAPRPPSSEDDGARLAPPRALRVETVRAAAQLLAALAHADVEARGRVKALEPLLLPAAGAYDDVADLLFNKMRDVVMG